MNFPLVSVVIPSFNHEEFIEEAILSIVDQDYDNVELIVIDDGSKDGSVEIIESLAPMLEKRFRRFCFIKRRNFGLCYTLNEGLTLARGKYFSPMASDDVALPHKLSYLVERIERESSAAVFGSVSVFGDRKYLSECQSGIIEHCFEDIILQKKLPAAPAALIDASVLREVGGYEEQLKIEDWPLWLKLSSKNLRLLSYPEVLTKYRRHCGNLSSGVQKMFEYRSEVLHEYSKSPLYDKAFKVNAELSARMAAEDNALFSLKLLFKYCGFSAAWMLVFLKIITPRYLIRVRRNLSM